MDFIRNSHIGVFMINCFVFGVEAILVDFPNICCAVPYRFLLQTAQIFCAFLHINVDKLGVHGDSEQDGVGDHLRGVFPQYLELE